MTDIASNQAFIIAAYTITWIAIIGYTARLVRKSARARAAYERETGRRGGSAR